jgi:hypothetical protein
MKEILKELFYFSKAQVVLGIAAIILIGILYILEG